MSLSDSNSTILLDAYQSGQELLVILRGRLVLDNCEAARVRLHSVIDPKIDKYYLYMGELEYVDSAGWGTMVGLKMAANRNRTKLCFLSPTERILDIFRISKLDSIFEIRQGGEAEIIRTKLEQTDNLLWRDSPDESQNFFNTESNMTPYHGGTLLSGAGVEKLDVREQRVEIERLSRDAVEHLRQGDYQKVIDRYLEVLDIDPDDLSALNNLGVVYEKRPEWNGRAVQTWKQVLTLSEKRNDSKHSERARRHLQSLEQLKVE